MGIGKVAAAAAGNQNLLADATGTLENNNTPAALAGLHGTHEASGPAAENDHIEIVDHLIQHQRELECCQSRCGRADSVSNVI